MGLTLTEFAFFFGIVPDKPSLPGGWHYVESEAEFLTCVDPNGQVFYPVTRQSDGKRYLAPCRLNESADVENVTEWPQ